MYREMPQENMDGRQQDGGLKVASDASLVIYLCPERCHFPNAEFSPAIRSGEEPYFKRDSMMPKKSGLIAPTPPASSQFIQLIIKALCYGLPVRLELVRMFSFETTFYDLANLWIIAVTS
jgi:hypothetical protein